MERTPRVRHGVPLDYGTPYPSGTIPDTPHSHTQTHDTKQVSHNPTHTNNMKYNYHTASKKILGDLNTPVSV